MQTGLISQALVIGSVNAAVYWTDEGLRALRLEPTGGYVDCSRQASLLLDCPAEKRWVVNINRTQLEASVALWSQRQRLLNWLIAGLDGDLSEETRRWGLELAEESWNAEISAFARARLLGCPLPEEAGIQGALKLADGLPHCHNLYSDLAKVAQYIQPVSRQLKEWVYYDYIGDTPADETYRTLLDHGIIAETVTLLAQRNAAGLDKLVIQFSDIQALREVCPRLPDLLTAWVVWLRKVYKANLSSMVSVPQKPATIHWKQYPFIVLNKKLRINWLQDLLTAWVVWLRKEYKANLSSTVSVPQKPATLRWKNPSLNNPYNKRLINASHRLAIISNQDPVKLFYLLYMLDIGHFREMGESCTGETYYAMANGPAPGTLRSLLVMRNLDIHAAIDVLTSSDSLGPWHFDANCFSQFALEILNDLIYNYREVGSKDISLDDNKAWWQVYNKGVGGIIPFELTLGSNSYSSEPTYITQSNNLINNGLGNTNVIYPIHRHKPK